MPDLQSLEDAILDALRERTGELTLLELLDAVHNRSGAADDSLVRMALWPLIASHKVELTEQMNLRVVAA